MVGHSRNALLALAVTLVTAACGGSPSGPTPPPPPPPAPTLSCPADIEAPARQGEPPAVTYATPTAQGGSAPVAVACTPASGSTFPLGSHTVTCTATDALARTASCTFRVTVSEVPVLGAVRFVAFGDSITEGTTSPDPTTLRLNPPESYPFKLQALLAARYIDQQVTVSNRGKAGEWVRDGERRLPDVLEEEAPQVLLLLHGANDLRNAGHIGDAEAAVPTIIGALEGMVKLANRRGIAVLLATFPPQNPEGSRGAGASGLSELNEEIRKLAADEGATLVDLFGGLGGTPVGSIGVDGLHPTESGYTKIAQIWFDAIKARYEQPGPTAPVLGPFSP